MKSRKEQILAEIDKLNEELKSIEIEERRPIVERKANKWLNSFSGKQLLKKHSLTEYGTWEVKGEDPNCDMGGYHHNPHLGYFEGTLFDVIKKAVELKGFYSWGSGGEISKLEPIKIQKA